MLKTEALDAAFRATTYRIESPDGVFDLRIGVPNSELDDFVRKQGSASWGIVTAYNPGGMRCDEENPLSHQRLMDRLKSGHWICFPACSIADDAMWPVEQGFLLLQAEEENICKLASEFSQLACVCGTVGSAPRLVWIEPVL